MESLSNIRNFPPLLIPSLPQSTAALLQTASSNVGAVQGLARAFVAANISTCQGNVQACYQALLDSVIADVQKAEKLAVGASAPIVDKVIGQLALAMAVMQELGQADPLRELNQLATTGGITFPAGPTASHFQQYGPPAATSLRATPAAPPAAPGPLPAALPVGPAALPAAPPLPVVAQSGLAGPGVIPVPVGPAGSGGAAGNSGLSCAGEIQPFVAQIPDLVYRTTQQAADHLGVPASQDLGGGFSVDYFLLGFDCFGKQTGTAHGTNRDPEFFLKCNSALDPVAVAASISPPTGDQAVYCAGASSAPTPPTQPTVPVQPGAPCPAPVVNCPAPQVVVNVPPCPSPAGMPGNPPGAGGAVSVYAVDQAWLDSAEGAAFDQRLLALIGSAAAAVVSAADIAAAVKPFNAFVELIPVESANG